MNAMDELNMPSIWNIYPKVVYLSCIAIIKKYSASNDAAKNEMMKNKSCRFKWSLFILTCKRYAWMIQSKPNREKKTHPTRPILCVSFTNQEKFISTTFIFQKGDYKWLFEVVGVGVGVGVQFRLSCYRRPLDWVVIDWVWLPPRCEECPAAVVQWFVYIL